MEAIYIFSRQMEAIVYISNARSWNDCYVYVAIQLEMARKAAWQAVRSNAVMRFLWTQVVSNKLSHLLPASISVSLPCSPRDEVSEASKP